MTPRQIVAADRLEGLRYLLWAINSVRFYSPTAQFSHEVSELFEEEQRKQPRHTVIRDDEDDHWFSIDGVDDWGP